MTDMVMTRRLPSAVRDRGQGGLHLVRALAGVQSRRLLRHPVLLVGCAWVVAAMAFSRPDTPYEKYSALTGMVAFLVGPLAFFAANLVASSERRSGAEEWMPCLPVPRAARTSALLVACLVPAGVAVLLTALVWLLVVQDGGLGSAMVLDWTHVASVPVTVLGGAVLGVAVARLLPWPGLPLVVMVALVAVNVRVQAELAYLGPYVDFAVWTDGDAVPAMLPGSGGWHLVYLTALTGLAASGALLRDARRPWLPFTAGAVFGVAVLVAGVAQLP